MNAMTSNASTGQDSAASLEKYCRRLTELLAEATGIRWTFGYIGNLADFGDDRSWYAFAEHPGHPGTPDDNIGGVPTNQLHLLAAMLQGALALSRVPEVKRRLAV